jgi:hypothetical protein
MTISLAFLAPDLIKAAIDGRLPHGMGVARLTDLPARVPQLAFGRVPQPGPTLTPVLSGNTILRGRDKGAKTAREIQSSLQRQNAHTNPRQFGAIRNEPGNLCLHETAWWAREA